MKVKVAERSAKKKRDCLRLRREGKIPAVLYQENKESKCITIDGGDFGAALRQIQTGRLPTTLIHLIDEKGKEIQVIVKDIQYHSTTYEILHLDFEEVHKGGRVTVRVPIEPTGVADCVGVKLGGVLRRVIRYLKVCCDADKIPAAFELDVTQLKLKQYKKLKDLSIPEGVTPLANMDEVAVVIAKR